MRALLSSLAGLAGLAVASVALGACNANLAGNAAKVDGQTISTARLTRTLEDISSNHDYTCILSAATGGLQTAGAAKGSYASSYAASILTTLVEERALAKAAATQGVTVGPFARSVAENALQSQLSPPQGSSCSASGAKVLAGLPADYRRFLVDLQAEQAALLAHGAGVPFTKAGMRRYAAAHPKASSLECVSAIETSSKAEATSLAAQVRAGASFAALAKKHSIDATSAPSGGALGCVLPSQIASSLGSSVAALGPGEVSAPIAFGSSWVIFQITSRKPAPLTEVAGTLIQQLASKDTALITAALRGASVQVDPAYGRWAKVSGVWQVVPPKGPPAALLANPAAVAPKPPAGPSPLG